MIGVAADSSDLEIAQEFFELFKTPWEPARPGRKYAAVLSTSGCIRSLDSGVFLVYGSMPHDIDRRAGVTVEPVSGQQEIEWQGVRFPAYGRVARFAPDVGPSEVRSVGTRLDYRQAQGARDIRRIGYDLFAEVRHLLTQGQPAAQAATPTMELHIALLRHLLQEARVSFVEIPPRPDGHDFICCLTHDVDFFGIRRHKFDSTLAGFVSRTSVGTLADVVRGRRPAAEAMRNWAALFSLPMVFLGLARDPWQPFDDYARLEKDLRSTFFLVPFKGRAGVSPDGTVQPLRAVPYQLSEVGEEARRAAARGTELAIHGIDAWRDSEEGRRELSQLTSLTGAGTAGIRMHWLYFTGDSPARLEEAGFDYDSTWGYNEAVGYKAGTSQVFRLQGTRQLLELPLAIMDSALFYPNRMGLPRESALNVCRQIVSDVSRFGGTLVINWHCRSVAPERLWGPFYERLLNEIRGHHCAWFATAAEAVNWFRWRRSIRFARDADSPRITVTAPAWRSGSPAAVLQICRAGSSSLPTIENLSFDGSRALTVAV